MNSFLTILCLCSIITLIKGHPCQGGEKCPDNLPYCTPVGCVFNCPDGVFLNGSNCVQDCADQYIFKSTCVPICPESSALIEEKINFKFKQLRFCRSECPETTFVYNKTCISACPKDSKFVEDGYCSSNCSESKPLHQNIYVDNRLVGIECRQSCQESSEHPFQRGNECMSECNEDQVVFDGKCLPECPVKAHVLISVEECIQLWKCPQGWPEQRYCSDICPVHSYVYNDSCVAECPNDMLYTLDGHCLSDCPLDKRYSYTPENVHFLGKGVKVCSKECPRPLYAINFTCVDVCPLGTREYERMCLFDCPNGTHVKYDSEMGSLRCVTGCENLIVNSLCTDSCPDDAKYIFESQCLPECPKSTYRIDNSFKCLKECPEHYKMLHANHCVINCPKWTNVYELSCLDECPNDTFRRIDSHTSEAKCVKSCDKYEHNRTCVESCAKYAINRTCVEECPSKYSVVYNNNCYSACPTNTCLMDNGLNCTDSCMKDERHNALVYKCPESDPYIRKHMSEKRCVTMCGGNEVLNDYECINITDCKRAVLSHGQCEYECPAGYLYMPKNKKRREVTTNGYHYTMEDAKDDPCVAVTNAYSTVILLGLVVVMYTVCFATFLSTVQIDVTLCGRKKQQNPSSEEEIYHMDLHFHPLSDFKVFDPRSDEESDIKKVFEDEPKINERIEGEIQDDEALLTLTENESGECMDSDDVPLLAASTAREGNNFEEYCMVEIHNGYRAEMDDDVPLLSTGV